MAYTLYTLANEAYVPAVVALVNSVREQGFAGPICIGSTEPLSIGSQANDGIEYEVLPESDFWPGNRKAELILARPAERFVFLDADMVVSDGRVMERFDEWLEVGPVFAIEALMSPVDYRRWGWARRLGLERPDRGWPMTYFNSGLFAGDFARDGEIVRRWHAAGEAALAPPARLGDDPDFPMADQDTLNAVLQDVDVPTVGLGPPDVWAAASPLNPFLHIGTFDPPAILHCTGKQKPWAFEVPPDREPHPYDLGWYRHVVAEPGVLRTDVEPSAQLRAWFEGEPLARAATRARHLRKRLLGE